MYNKLIIAHRGASFYTKENTIKSFEKAIGMGADMIEFDVRRTKDAILIAYHDESINGKPIGELEYREIRDILRSKGVSAPTVKEILELARGKIKLDVEIKQEGHEEDIIRLLLEYFENSEFIVTSFNDVSLKIIKHSYPDVRVGLLLGKEHPKNVIVTRLSELFPIRRAKRVNADFLIPHWKLLKFGFLNRAKRNNMPVLVWTVNDEGMIRNLLKDDRVDGIITDRPDLAKSLRDRISTIEKKRD